MKPSVLFLFYFFVLQLSAQQRITVIDKNGENGFLFDEKNPQSLVSLFNSNQLPFKPMNILTSERLSTEGFLKNAPVKYGRQSDVALANIYGEDSIALIDGVLQYVYPMPDRYFTDLEGISRLLIYEHQNEKTEWVIDSIGYAKKYTDGSTLITTSKGKYELVGSIDFKAIDLEYDLFYVEQSAAFQQLMTNGFWTELRTKQLAENPVNTTPLLNWHSIMSVEYYAFTFNELQEDRPFDQWWSKRDFNWPIAFNGIKNNLLSEYEEVFGKGKVHGILDTESDWPLANIDGEDSMIITNGVLQYVYPEPDFHVSWIDVEPTKAWLIYSVSAEAVNPVNELKRIVFTKGEDNILLADFDCTDSRVTEFYLELLQKAGIQLQIPVSENWKIALLKAQTNGKKYSTSKKGDLKRLENEFTQNN